MRNFWRWNLKLSPSSWHVWLNSERDQRNSLSLLNRIASLQCHRRVTPISKTYKNFFHFICLTCAFFCWKNIFYVTVNKWDVAQSFVTSRQPVCKLNFTIIGVHIGFFCHAAITSVAAAADVHLRWELKFFWWICVKRKGTTLSNDFGPAEMRETPS